MFTEAFPQTINPLQLARKGDQLRGVLPLSQMQRLSSLLLTSAGEVSFSLHFALDEAGVPFVKGNCSTELELTCQRCMQPCTYVVDAAFCLSPVRDELAAEQLPQQYEALLMEAEKLSVLELIEDELILSIPLIVTHEQCVVETAQAPQAAMEQLETKKNPFTVLAKLKRDLSAAN